jgi:hypothetical protein
MSLTHIKLKRQNDLTDTYAIWDGIDRIYRYVLYREWNPELYNLVIIGLNPSAADEEYDDRTVRRCINFAKREKCGSLTMLNAFAFRATNPDDLWMYLNTIGDKNDHFIWSECQKTSKIVIAWGTHGKSRQARILRILHRKTLYCFGTNKDGTPKHPLYLSNDAKLEVFKNE